MSRSIKILDEGLVDVFCGSYSVVRGKVREEGKRRKARGDFGR